jgi:hypothetical protein
VFQRHFSLLAAALTALCATTAHADEPTWAIKLATNPNVETARGVGVDRDRNVYTVGTTGGLLFATSNTGQDAWITKHDASGAVKWSKQLATEDGPVGVAVIPSFGPVMLGSDGASPYAAKFNQLNGTREWKTVLPGGGARTPVAIATGEGDWYTYAVGGGAGHVNEPRFGAKDGWIIKLDGSGGVVWKRHVGTAENDQIDAVAFDGGTGVYVAGQTWGTNTEYFAGGVGYIWVRHAWVAKYDKDGNFLWKQTVDGSRVFSERAVAVAASSTGVYLVGLTDGTVGAGASYGGDDVWIARYNQNGQRSWLMQTGTTANDKAEGAVVDRNGNLLLAGTSSGNMAGGTAGSTDAWVRKYGSTGVLLWKKWVGTISPDTCHGVAVDAKGGVILVGDSSGALGGTSTGTTDAFIAKFDQPRVSLVIEPQYRTVKRGGFSTQYPIIIDRNDFTGLVDFTLTGDTAGLTCSFSNDLTKAASSALNCWTQTATTLGIHNLQVTATGTGVTIAPIALQANVIADGSVSMSLAPATATLNRGQSTTVNVTLARSNFPDPVSMSVTGLPAGMTASWNPQTVGASATTTTLTLQTAADMLPGVYSLTVRGNATGVTIPNKIVTVTVNAPPQVRLYAAQNARTVNAGQSATYTIDLIRTAFSGSVTLGTSALPAGVTASFSPSAATGNTATLTVTTTGTAPGGPLNFYVTGGATGVTIERLPLTLNVIAPSSVVLSASTTTRTITAGQSTTFPIALTRSNFTAAVTLGVTGFGSGVSASFSPGAPTGTSSTLSLTTGAGSAGNYTLTITGTAAGVTILPITVQLIVLAPTGVTLTAAPTSATISQTQTASYTVTINRSNFTGAVTLAAAAVPGGATITFNPPSTTGNTVTVTIATTSQTSSGSFDIILSGTATGVTIAPISIRLNVNALRIVAQAHKKCKNGTNAEFTLDYLQPDGTYVPNASTGPYHFTLTGNANLITRWSANWYQCATSNWTPTDRPWYVRTYQSTASPGTSLMVRSAGVIVYDAPLGLNAGHWEINLAETTTLPGDYYVLAP